jgi:hypothetical protein
MYFLTDNTMTKIERAFLIAACQPTTANYSDLYTGNKGDIQFAEVALPFNGFFINNDYVYQKAQDMLLAMRNPANLTATRVIVDSNNFKYNAIAHAGISTKAEGGADYNTPNYWSEENGRLGKTIGENANLVNSDNRRYWGYTPGKENGNANGDPDTARYADVVASMSGSEHAILTKENDNAYNGGVATNSTQTAASVESMTARMHSLYNKGT